MPRPGPAPEDLAVGPLMGTRMACPEPEMATESRYLAQLAGVTKFGFPARRLALIFQGDGKYGVMLFDRTPPPAPVL